MLIYFPIVVTIEKDNACSTFFMDLRARGVWLLEWMCLNTLFTEFSPSAPGELVI